MAIVNFQPTTSSQTSSTLTVASGETTAQVLQENANDTSVMIQIQPTGGPSGVWFEVIKSGALGNEITVAAGDKLRAVCNRAPTSAGTYVVLRSF